MEEFKSLAEKLHRYFPKMIVNKGANQGLFGSMAVPGYIRDWFCMRYADADGTVTESVGNEMMQRTIPSKKQWQVLLDQLMHEGKTVSFLAKVRVRVDVARDEICFALPDLQVDYRDTVIEPGIWAEYKEHFVGEDEVWGVVKLAYGMYQKVHRLKLLSFQVFRPYSTDLPYYKRMAAYFSIDEWIDVLLTAMDYRPEGFAASEKLMMLRRLLPFVEKRINLIELAPKGTGKSYVFSQLSKYGWLATGGVMSRAKLFYDMKDKSEGLVAHYDYVALDEIATIRFTDLGEIQGAMKGYMESGTFSVGVQKSMAESGMVFLGNIPVTQMNPDVNMFATLPVLFRDSALVDRIHGLIEGWKIPRMDEKMKARGWALNAEYFSEILHALRNDPGYASVVEELLDIREGDTRDIHAVKKMATAFLKILFPYVEKKEDIDPILFRDYCLTPAVEMRTIVKKQLMTMDKEYLNRPMPRFELK